MKLELVSFSLCPYVQRSVITLKHKKVPYTFKEIDLFNPPEWFEKISPLGKVPVLIVGEKTVLFESAVINEFIDEITEPRLMASDPLRKARERAWIEFASELLGIQYALCTAETGDATQEQRKELFETMSRLETELGKGPYFGGTAFSLVDTSFAPLFVRLKLFKKIWNADEWKSMPRVRGWAEALLELPAVRDSVKASFAEDFRAYMREHGNVSLFD